MIIKLYSATKIITNEILNYLVWWFLNQRTFIDWLLIENEKEQCPSFYRLLSCTCFRII